MVIVNYLKEVIVFLLQLLVVFFGIITMFLIVLWDIPSADRFFTDGFYMMIRVIIFFSFIIPLFCRIRLTITKTNLWL